MTGKRPKGKHFVLGKDFREDGHTRVSKGTDWLVEGGTKESHEETSDTVNEFSKRLRKEKSVDPQTAEEILKDVLYERKKRN